MELKNLLQQIKPVDQSLKPALLAHQADLTKPAGALGRLEEIAVQLGLIQGKIELNLGKKRIYCFAGDHGIADAGVSAFPQAVTPQMVLNMLSGGAAINQLTEQAGAELLVVDMGVKAEFEDHPRLIKAKVALGTANFLEQPAMTLAQTLQAVTTGFELATQAQAEGVRLLGTGEMGIANTTSAAALMSALLPIPPAQIVGRGTGIDDPTLAHKIKVIETALIKHQRALATPLDILAALGGLEIAGIVGLILGAAANQVAILVDGFISSAAALVALRLKPEVAGYLFFSHLSAEQGHKLFIQKMGITPLIDLDLRLGEGTGAAIAMNLLEAAVFCHNRMATFSGAKVSTKSLNI